MLLNFIIFILIIVPISLFTHELGHLLGAKYLKADRVIISIGTGKKLYSLNYKNIKLDISLFVMFHAYTNSERKPEFSNKEFALITAMGPLLSLLLTGIIGLILLTITSEIMIYFFYFNLWLSVINMIPFKLRGQKSDGYLIWELLK